MKKGKIYSLDEVLDEHIGKKGTLARIKFEVKVWFGVKIHKLFKKLKSIK
jgi:hypothetical protein